MGWRPLLLYSNKKLLVAKSYNSRLEAIASRLEAMAFRCLLKPRHPGGPAQIQAGSGRPACDWLARRREGADLLTHQLAIFAHSA